MKKILLGLCILLAGCATKQPVPTSATCTLKKTDSEITVTFNGEDDILETYTQTRKISVDSLIQEGYKSDELDSIGQKYQEEYSKYADYSTFTYKIEDGFYSDELVVNEINLTTAELFDLKYDKISIADSVTNFTDGGYTCESTSETAQ